MKRKGFDYLKAITAVDYTDRLEVLYLLYNTTTKEQETLLVKLTAPLKVSTIMHVYGSADWYERELSEMFGIKIDGREASRLLLEKWNGADAPLRKGFAWGKPYRKVS
ncbi:NADH-quinone oxidoreductase subunit C [Candidatus Marsarchaeota archaeon]|nr:NADH-quinone oxidoreductase subunit C [Candidatus Marsarchaeota archaeon]MCL5099522.1 NADH-quinone oxidoreductase subunit C [Candidatus Marsarchaeota archaeon]